MRIRFGPFELDDERFQLTRDGLAVALRPKAFDLLTMLVRERSRVVRREELFERLWSTTAVGFGSLSGLVNELRSALGECGRGPSSIRTVHARGYQFVAPVTAIGTGEAAETGAAQVAQLGRRDSEPDSRAPAAGPAANLFEATACEAPDGWLGERLVVALGEVSRAGSQALVASIPGALERSRWLARAASAAIETGFRPRFAAGPGWESGDAARPGVRAGALDARRFDLPGTAEGRGERVPIALCLEVEDPGSWGRIGGLRRLLDLLGRAPVLVIAALAARADESDVRLLVAGDRRIECVAEFAPPRDRDGGAAVESRPSVSDELARALGALARSDRLAFEVALRSMGFEAVRSEPIRALRRVDPSARESTRAKPGFEGRGL
jgi:DNA-binding winged helix-turn-helix (wHTH) protein